MLPPNQGKERDYLKSNRDRAVKVLQQQIKKYANDTDTKQTILEAFDKLFKNGHAKLLSDLSEEEQGSPTLLDMESSVLWVLHHSHKTCHGCFCQNTIQE